MIKTYCDVCEKELEPSSKTDVIFDIEVITNSGRETTRVICCSECAYKICKDFKLKTPKSAIQNCIDGLIGAFSKLNGGRGQ